MAASDPRFPNGAAERRPNLARGGFRLEARAIADTFRLNLKF
jgi:hypothetical protein